MSFGTAGSIADLAGLLFWLGLIGGAAYAMRKRWRRPPDPVPDEAEGESYRVYTRAYDLELTAADVPAKFAAASPDALHGWYQQDHALWLPCIPRVATLLAEQDGREWDDALARVAAAAESLAPGGLVVALLIDHSGSMKGARIAWAAVLATRIVELLAGIGARSEILGFSTAGWHGGKARADWLDAGRPARPGRLCALMHIVYKSADEDALAEAARNVMLDPALLRENVDGEALLWAQARLAARPERHKLLIMVSDGAPVDDATLLHNGPSYLWRHLMAVLRDLSADVSLTLGGLGIGHRVDEWYPISEKIEGPRDLAGAAGRLLAAMIAAAAARGS